MIKYGLEDVDTLVVYTFLYVTSKNKVVKIKAFNTLDELKEYKNFYVPELKNSELTQVDKDGYVWFSEVTDND